MKRNTLISCFLLLLISINSKTFSQNQGLSIVCKADRIDTLDSSPRLLASMQYNRIIFYDGKHICYVNYRCSVIDDAGNVIIPEAHQLITRNGDIFEVRKNGRHMLIDAKGKVIGEYNHLTKISDQLYRARENNKLGIVDVYGKEIVPCEYKYVGINSDSKTIKIRKGNKYGIVDLLGNMIAQCEYDFIREDNDFYRVRKNGKWGVIDSNGRMTISLEYDHLGACENGVFIAKKGDYLGCIDKNNRVLFDFKYIYINPFIDGVAEACEGEDFVLAGNQLIAKLYEKRGYVLLETPTRWMAMCKNPVYSQLKIGELSR